MSEALRKRCLKTIERECFRRKHRFTGKKLGRFVLVAAIVIALFTTAYATVPTVRAGTLNLLLEVQERFTSWGMGSSANVDEDSGMDIYLSWLPNSYTLSAPENDGMRTWVDCEGPNNETIHIAVFDAGDNSSFGIDTENPDYYDETTIQGYPAQIIIKHGFTHIVWADTDLNVFVSCEFTGVGMEDAIRVAEGLDVVFY